MPIVYTVPVAERIAEVIEQRLLFLVAGSSVLAPVVEVVRPQRTGGYTPRDWQVVLTNGEVERIEELDCPGNPPAIAWQQRYEILCRVMNSEREDRPVDHQINVFAIEVQKAITNGPTWYTMGGLAFDSGFATLEGVDGDGGPEGIIVPLLVTYRVSETDPYEVRA